MTQRTLRTQEGWLGEFKGNRGSNDEIKALDLHDVASSQQFREAQEEDMGLQELQATAVDAVALPQAPTTATSPRFEVRQHLLYRVQTGGAGESERTQLVVPSCLQQAIWQLAHPNPTRGHMGRDRTTTRISWWFFWLFKGET